MIAAPGVIAASKSGFNPSILNPQIILDSAGLVISNPQSWTPTTDIPGIGLLSASGTFTATNNWLGSGKNAILFTGSGSGFSTANGSWSIDARTWSFVGRFPATPGGTEAYATNYSAANPIFPMFIVGSGTSIGTDFAGGSNNRALITIDSSYWNKPFVFTVSAISTSEFRAHLLCNGNSLTGLNTTSVASLYPLSTRVSVGAWLGAFCNSDIAAIGVYDNTADAATLLSLAQYWSNIYGSSNF